MVSIVVTCYNYSAFVARCLESILRQTHADFEAIVIDDGSTDNSPEVIGQFLADARFRYVRQDNAGQARAKNRGVSLARGEHIAFLDADDSWRPDKLAKQLRIMDDPDVGVVYSLATYVDESDIALPFALSGRFLAPREGRVTDYLFVDNFVPFSSVVVRKACLERFGTFDESLAMGIDWDLWLRISTAFSFRCLREPLLNYRMGHANQMSRNLEVRQRCSDRIMNSFLAAYPGAVDPRFIRVARWYTAMNRGMYYRFTDRAKSTSFFVQALRWRPWSAQAMRGLARNLLTAVFRVRATGSHGL